MHRCFGCFGSVSDSSNVRSFWFRGTADPRFCPFFCEPQSMWLCAAGVHADALSAYGSCATQLGGTQACNLFVRMAAVSSAARPCGASKVPSCWVALLTLQQNAHVWARLMDRRLVWDKRPVHCTVQVFITVRLKSNELLSTSINTQCPSYKAARLVTPHRPKLSLN
jgi:hypothetical protein